MKTKDFHYELPEALIAQHPPKKRDGGRLLVLSADGELIDSQFPRIDEYLKPGDLLVLNDTKVIPARVYANKESGGRIEIMLERIVNANNVIALLRSSKAPKAGSQLYINDLPIFRVIGRDDDMFQLQFIGGGELTDFLDTYGHIPLPPYINREDELQDKERYQTVFSDKPGAVAAPTAGLHFTDEILNKLNANGVENVRLTLHVGAGTFQPVRVDDVKQHKMHSEFMSVNNTVVDKIKQVKRNDGRVIAVGTTVVRSLETAAAGGQLKPYEGETSIFIYPGFQFNVVDLLITNFHLPESTLLMLVSAFAGKENIMHAYQHAVREKYRFFSYGDAMLLEGVKRAV